MDRDNIYHKDVLKRASDRMDVGIKPMRKYVKNYLAALGSFITEADPERNVRMYGVGILKVRNHKGHKGRKGFKKGDSGEVIEVPAHRSLRIDPYPRVRNVLKSSIEKLYNFDADA